MTRVDAGAIQFTGDVLAAWPAEGLDLPWGVGFNGNVWLTDPLEEGDICGFADACTIHEFDRDGVPGTVLDAPWATGEEWPADMAFDADRGLLWTVHVGGDNGLYGIDPADGSVEQVITGDPWSDISQRGVAYDGDEDAFYVGGWNEGVIYKVAGPSWPTPGETLSSCLPADPSISGLAWNPSFDLLWMATNSEFDDIFLLDPTTCEILSAVFHPEPGGNGAGLELDAGGNLWTVSQNGGTAYLLESGLPVFSDAPWLTVAPEAGNVPVDGTANLSVEVDSTGLAPGTYRADVVVLTNDPDASAVPVPVKLVVPAYQQGINAGGPGYTAAERHPLPARPRVGRGKLRVVRSERRPPDDRRDLRDERRRALPGRARGDAQLPVRRPRWRACTRFSCGLRRSSTRRSSSGCSRSSWRTSPCSSTSTSTGESALGMP